MPCVHWAYRFGFLVLSLSLGLALKIAFQWTQKKKVLSLLKESDRPIFRHILKAIEMKSSSFLSLSFDAYRFLLTSIQCNVILIESFGQALIRFLMALLGKCSSNEKYGCYFCEKKTRKVGC